MSGLGRPGDGSHSVDAERCLVPIIGATVILCTAVYSFRFASFTHPKELIVGIGLLVAGAVFATHRGRLRDGVWPYAPLWLLLLWSAVVHGALGAAAVPIETVAGLVKLSTLLLFGALAFEAQRSARGRQGILLSILGSALVVAVMALCQYVDLLPRMFPRFPGYDQRIYSTFGNQDLLGGYMAMGLPLAIHFFVASRSRVRVGLALLVAIVLLVVLLLSGSRSAWLAATVAAAVYAVFGYGSRVSPRKCVLLVAGLGAVAIVVCAAAPDATVGRIEGTFRDGDVGAQTRLWIWDATARMAVEHPIAGVGLGNYPYWSPHCAGTSLNAPGGEARYSNEIPILHAHSDPLELLAEMGALGILLGIWMLARLLRLRGPEWGGIGALLVFSLFNGVYHSPPHALAGILLAGNLLAGSREPSNAGRRIESDFPLLPWFVPIAATGTIVFNTLAVAWPSLDLAALPSTVDVSSESSSEKYERALARPWPSPIADVQWSMSLLAEGKAEEARPFLIRAKKRLDTGRLHYLLGYLAKLEGDTREAEAAYQAAVWRWPRNVDAWIGLMKATPDERWEERIEGARRWLSTEEITLLERVRLD